MLRCTASNRFVSLLAFAAIALGGPPAAGASITGICPDGSLFIVQRPESIPCRDAKRIEPHEVPPLKPEFLPRPYSWEVFNQRNDPNNPYNLIDAAREQRGLEGANAPPPTPDPRRTPPQPPPEPESRTSRAAPSPPSAAPRTAEPLDLGLTDQEQRDLALIVELAQQRAPATLARRTGDGGQGLVLRLARSAAFESRLHQAAAARGSVARGHAILFVAVASSPESFYANLTFVQGHVAFHPDSADPNQFGVIRGRLGALVADEWILGYAVLPENLDPSRPMDIYWNDRQLTAQLIP
jgi:hypothetical protein